MRRSPYREMKKQDTEYTPGARAHLSLVAVSPWRFLLGGARLCGLHLFLRK